MPATMKDLGLDRLTEDERVMPAHELLRSIHADAVPGSTLTDAKRAELARRLAHLEAHPGDVVPWEQVKAEMLARVRQVREGRT